MRGLRHGTAEEANQVADRVLQRVDLLSAFPVDSPFYIFAVAPYYLTGRFAPAERLVDRGIGEARERGLAISAGQLLMGRAALRMHRGALAGAEADAHEGLELAREEGGFFAAMAVGALVDICLARGHLEEAASAAQLLPAGVRESGSMLLQVWRLACAEQALARNRPAEALTELRAIEAWEHEWGARNGVWCAWRPPAARAYAGLGDAPRAAELADVALTDARGFGAPHPLGVALLARAAVVEGERRAMLEEAAELLRDDDSRLLYLRVLTALGIARREARELAGARRALEEALSLSQEFGALELHALAELVAAGGKPRRATTAGPRALTPAERQTAELAAQGLKNREIAQALFVTAKTVETHLSKCLSEALDPLTSPAR